MEDIKSRIEKVFKERRKIIIQNSDFISLSDFNNKMIKAGVIKKTPYKLRRLDTIGKSRLEHKTNF